MIEFKNVKKDFKGNVLFEDINITFPMGKKIGIIGTNGSGKSVLMKMIVGYSNLTQGEIWIDDKLLKKDFDFIPNAGVSINAPEFTGSMSGIDNLLQIAKIRRIATKTEIYELARKLNFENELKKKYKKYSLGMKQKMRIIQALMDKPRYLILDEPFDALDAASKVATKKLLEDFISADNMLIFSSHGEEIFDFADRIYSIEDHHLNEVEAKK